MMGSASAESLLPQPPQLVGKVAPNGDLVALFVAQGPGGVLGSGPVSDGDLLYVDSVSIAIYHPGGVPSSASVTVRQFVAGSTTQQISVPGPNGIALYQNISVPTYDQSHWSNSSVSLAPRAVTYGSVGLLKAFSQRSDLISVDGVSWNVSHQSLPSVAPFALLTTGGVDLLVILVIFEVFLVVVPTVGLARTVQRRGQGWAPKFKFGIWGGVSGAVVVFGVFAAYPQIDLALGGLSFLAYAPLAAPLVFLWALSLFNRGSVTTILRPDVSADATKFSMNVWEPRLSSTPTGDLIYVEETWSGWAKGAVFGKVTRVYARLPRSLAEAVEGPPVFLPVRTRALPPPPGRHRIRYRRLRWTKPSRDPKRRRPSLPHRENVDVSIEGLPPDVRSLVPLHQDRLFAVTNAGDRHDAAKAIAWVDHDSRFEVDHPHLTFRRLEPRRMSDGQLLKDPESGDLVTRPKLTWPHFTEGRAIIDLAGIHWVHQARVLQGAKRITDVTRALEARTLEVFALKAEIQRGRDRQAEVYANELVRLTGREDGPATDEQLQEEIDAWSRRDKAGDDKGRADEVSRPDRKNERKGRRR